MKVVTEVEVHIESLVSDMSYNESLKAIKLIDKEVSEAEFTEEVALFFVDKLVRMNDGSGYDYLKKIKKLIG